MTKWLSINLGIERLSGYLNKYGHCSRTYDTNLFKAKALVSQPSLQEILLSRRWDIIGFSVMEETLVEDISNMMMANRLCPDALVIVGGHAAQFDYQTILDKSPARIVVLGEGEIPLLQIANGTPLGDIPGIIVKNKAVPLSQEQFVEATLAIDYEQIPYEIYWDYYVQLYQSNNIKITDDISKMIHTIRIFTRNYCPMRCKFCSSTNFLNFASGRKMVPIVDITGKALIDLLKRVIAAHPRVETFYFTDDDFCCKKTALKEFCNLVIKENITVTFIAFARIDDLDNETIKLMKKAGFRTLNMGLENTHAEILKEFNKSYTPDVIDSNLELLHTHGIKPATTFILCSPEAKLEWIESNVRKIIDLMEKNYISPGINVCVQPQKGSRFHEEYSEFEAQMLAITGTNHLLKRNHFIKCTDLEAREFQYRFLHHWAQHIDKEAQIGGSHLNSQTQSAMKLKLILDIIAEIKSERGDPDRFKYSSMTAEEKDVLWNTLQKYSYGASL
ncbi:MAG: radical SAM protein [Desulfuromonadaceae bacterium]|nr:radical SAM protein [Desulfuromonadaceae bacterium]